MGKLAARSARDASIADLMRKADAAWHQWLSRLLEGLVPDASAGAALVMPTLRALFVLPEASRRRERVEQALGKLEGFLGL
jgi:hypothetical protein